MENLHELAEAWRDAKRAETQANKRRVEIEQRIIAITGCKEEGSTTHDADGLKITVKGKLTRSLDQAAWEQIAPTIPEALRPVTYKPALDLKGLRYLENNEPEIYRQITPALTIKPAKPAVAVKE